MKVYHIFDCNAICWWCINRFKNAEDYELNNLIIFHFFNVLRNWMEVSLNPTKENYHIFCWDSKEKHRKTIFPEYKAHRDNKKIVFNNLNVLPLFYEQMNRLKNDVLPSLGFKNIFEQQGYEADDLIAWHVLESLKKDIDITKTIYTRDSDLYQLLYYKRTRIFWANEFFSKHDFIEKYGFDPDMFAFYKALVGDPSDNIKGVKGIGPKKATTIIHGHKNRTSEINEPDIIEHVTKTISLISLPLKYPSHPINPMVVQRDRLSASDFEKVFKSLDFRFFLKSDTMHQWHKFFGVI